jgi:tripartite ATP-independent transporter DctM subunit
MEIGILVISFLVLIGIGVPIAWSLGMSSILTLWVSTPFIPAVTTIAQRMATGLDSFGLLAIPFFILAGEIMNQGGIARRLVAFAKALVGSLPGGLAYVNIIAAMLFGAIAGSAVAAVSALGSSLGKEMEKEGYSKEFSAAVNTTSGTMGLIIPPSNILIVYSLASGGISIATLFLAGYLPGILIGLFLMITVAIQSYIKKFPTGHSSSFRQIWVTFLDALPSLFLLFIIMGGIISGIFTATEGSSVAVFYCLILTAIYKEIKLNELPQIFLKAVSTTAVVLLLVGTSICLSWVMAYENIPGTLIDFTMSVSQNKFVILLIINLLLIFVGFFMDITPAVLIFTPIFLPVVTQIGIDPVHFGMIMILNLCIGLCTPPVGSVLFVGVSVAETTIQKIIKPMIPFLLAMLLTLLLINIIPEISLWLPGLFN